MTVSGVDVARYAHDAGFPNSQLVTAVAIAYAESSFNETSTHHNQDGSTDYGLWQINSVHNFPEVTSGAWRDPRVNAQLAYRVYTAQGWNAWSTHKPTDPVGYARYTAAIPFAVSYVTAAYGPVVAAEGSAMVGVGTVQGVGGVVQDTVTNAANIAQAPLAALKFLEQPGTWVRIGKFMIGIALVIGGLVLVAKLATDQTKGA